MKNKFQSNDAGVTMGGASVQHPFSIRSASDGTTRKPRGWKYILSFLLVLAMSIGQMWATDYEADPFVSITSTSDTIQIVTTKSTLRFRNVSSKETLSSGAVLYGGAYQTSSNNKTYTINVGSNPTSRKMEAYPYWLVLYSPDAFQAGDSIVVGSGYNSSNNYWLKFMAASSSTYNTNLHGGTSLATPNATDWDKNVDYYYILPANFTTSNYIAFQSTGGTCYYKYIKFYHVDTSGGGDDPGDTPTNYAVTHTLTNVTATSGATGASAATEGSAYNAVFAANKLGYSLPSTIGVTIGGEAATVGTDYTWNSSTGAFQVPAAKVTGNIVVTIAGVAPVKTFKSDYSDFTQVGETNAYYTYLAQEAYTSYAVAGWTSYENESFGSKKLKIDPATDEAISGSNASYGAIRSDRIMEYYLTGVSSVKFYIINGGSSGDPRVAKYTLNGGDETTLVSVAASTSNTGTIELDPSTNNTIRLYGTSDLHVGAMKVMLPPSCSAPTSPAISGTTSYTEGDNISLTASATGTDGSTTYAWYKGADWATASATSSIGSAATLTINSCSTSDAGTYWCEISNGSGCEAQVSQAITVAEASATKYNVNIGSMTNGSVSADLTEAAENATVTLTVTPSTGYRLASLSVTGDETSSTVTVTNNQFEMPAEAVTVNATFELIPTYTVTLNPNNGTIESYDGWTLSAGKYTKTVAEGTELDLLVFTRSGYEFMTWRAGAVDKTSPITVNAAIELKAIWGTEEETEIYYWEGGSAGATQRGGTATHYNGDSPVEGNTRVNYYQGGYYSLSLNKNDDYSADHIRIALDEALKEGDKIEMTGYCDKDGTKSVGPKVSNSSNVVICTADDVPDINGGANGGVPTTQTKTLNSSAEGETTIKLTRSNGATTVFITKLVITRTEVVEEMDPAEQPTITTQPTGGTYAWNATTTQTVVATVSDGGTLSYQWYKKGTTDEKVGTNSASYAPTVSGTYYVIITNTKTGYAKTTKKSNEVAVTINARPEYKVAYYDGSVKLGEETVLEGASPVGKATYETFYGAHATFGDWYSDADLAEGHKIANVAALTISDNTSVFAKFTKSYAVKADLGAEAAGDKTAIGTFLSGKNYTSSIGSGNSAGYDTNASGYLGFKFKNNGDWIEFLLQGGKMAKIAFMYIETNMSVKVGSADAVNVSNKTTSSTPLVKYYYSANDVVIKITNNCADTKTAVINLIDIIDPITVTYDATTNGGSCATEDATFTGTALTLPEATKSGWQFDGWFTTANDESETGVLVGEAGDTYTPSANITLYARFTETTTLATLTDIKVNGTTVAGFAVDKFEYNIALPYKTSVVPTVAYTKGYSGATVTMTPSTITSVFGDVTLHVVSEDESNENDYVLHITEAPKDMLCLIQATHTGATTATVTGYIGGTPDKNTQGNSKLGSKGHYFGIQLTSGTFQAGDVVLLRTAAGADTNGDKVRIFKSNAASAENVLVEGTTAMIYGDNYVTLPETSLNQLYLRRGTDEEAYNTGWNPWIAVFAVYRPYPNPLVGSMAINSIDVTVNNATSTKTITGVMPSGTNFASLSISNIAYLSNNPSETDGVLSGSWNELTSQYEGTFTVTDKDFDETVYTVTLTEDVAVESVTISGETTVAAKSQITLTATVLPAGVANKNVIWSSSDASKATVDANGVVTGKAAGNVTITATSQADGSIYDTYAITVTPFVGTEYAYWFAKAADATANGVTNDDGTIFEGAPTDGSNLSASLTMEVDGVETTYNVTRRSGDDGFGTFHVPANFTANLYMLVIGSGSPRTLTLKETSTNAEYASTPATFGSEATQIVFENIPSGNYSFDKHSQGIRLAVMVAELNSYPLTSVSIEEGFNLRLGNSRTPAITLNPTKAVVASKTWSEVSRTGASDAELNTTTGVITAGTEEGSITVKVSVTDAFGNTRVSGNCVVNIVNIIDQELVTGSITWNWSGAAASNTQIDDDEILVLANYLSGDQWAKLKGTKNDYAYKTDASGSYESKGTLSFTTTVPGLVTITARRISNDADIKIGSQTIGTVNNTLQTFTPFFVPAGEVNIVADASKGMRITSLEFDADLTPDKVADSFFKGYTRDVTQGYYGTICLPNGGIMTGATLFELAYFDATQQKIFFDEILNGVMVAGTPYIFLPKEGASQLGVYYTDDANAPAGHANGLYGSYTEAHLEANLEGNDGNYILYNNKYYFVDSDNVWVGANRAYIKLGEAWTVSSPAHAPKAKAGCRRISMGAYGEEEATGIGNVQGDQVQNAKVMIDGQLFIICDDKMYDATGKQVK